jgi:hypothetical protein
MDEQTQTRVQCVTLQSHDWGRDLSISDYIDALPFKINLIEAVYENQVTGYCGGGDHPAVGMVIMTGEELLAAVGYPCGYEHCRIQVVFLEGTEETLARRRIPRGPE